MSEERTWMEWPEAPTEWVGEGSKFPNGKPLMCEDGAIRAAEYAIRSADTFGRILEHDPSKQRDYSLGYLSDDAKHQIEDHLAYMYKPLPKNYVHRYRQPVFDYVVAVREAIFHNVSMSMTPVESYDATVTCEWGKIRKNGRSHATDIEGGSVYKMVFGTTNNVLRLFSFDPLHGATITVAVPSGETVAFTMRETNASRNMFEGTTS